MVGPNASVKDNKQGTKPVKSEGNIVGDDIPVSYLMFPCSSRSNTLIMSSSSWELRRSPSDDKICCRSAPFSRPEPSRSNTCRSKHVEP